MKIISLLCFGALAMFSNVANAAMCKDFDEDMNIIEYECGTSLQKALEQQKQKKLEAEHARQKSFDEDDVFAEFDTKSETKKSKTDEDSFFGSYKKKSSLERYIGANLIYVPSAKLSGRGGNFSIGSGHGFNLVAGAKQGRLRGDFEFKYLTGMSASDGYDYTYDEQTQYYYDYQCDEYGCQSVQASAYFTSWQERIVYRKYDYTSMNFMLNGYYDIISHGSLSVFVGGGFGLVLFDEEMIENGEHSTWYDYYNGYPYKNVWGQWADEETRSSSTYAYQISAGMSFALNKSIVLDFAYRYNGTGEMNDLKMTNSELSLGGRIMF